MILRKEDKKRLIGQTLLPGIVGDYYANKNSYPSIPVLEKYAKVLLGIVAEWASKLDEDEKEGFDKNLTEDYIEALEEMDNAVTASKQTIPALEVAISQGAAEIGGALLKPHLRALVEKLKRYSGKGRQA
jgi:hypothetical protein